MIDQRQRLVRKRDGSLEPFSPGKLRRVLAIAMQACQYDVRLADSLSQAVMIHVRDSADDRPTSSDYIFRCIRAVLSETGLDDVAKQLIVHRRCRAMRRRSLQVVDTRRSARPPESWSKQRVMQALVRRHHVGEAAARTLAGEIEERVLALNYSIVSSSLVAELIKNELLAWGLADELLAVRADDGRAEQEADEDFREVR